MNILFIEDERELAQTGVAQLELLSYHVYSAQDLKEAREVMDDPDKRVDLIIADHRLPDGQGIQFAIEMKAAFPSIECVIVSGCLTSKDIELLEANELRYYHKPLLYAKVVDELRRSRAMRAPTREISESSEAEPESESKPEPESEVEEEAEVEEEKKSLFGFFEKWSKKSK